MNILRKINSNLKILTYHEQHIENIKEKSFQHGRFIIIDCLFYKLQYFKPRHKILQSCSISTNHRWSTSEIKYNHIKYEKHKIDGHTMNHSVTLIKLSFSVEHHGTETYLVLTKPTKT
jgi:hypothetical protein